MNLVNKAFIKIGYVRPEPLPQDSWLRNGQGIIVEYALGEPNFAFPNSDIRVIITPSHEASDKQCAPVPVATHVNAHDFTLTARNCDLISDTGSAGFYWMAVCEFPPSGTVVPGDIQLRMGMTQPKPFIASANDPDAWDEWSMKFSKSFHPIGTNPANFLTASNHGRVYRDQFKPWVALESHLTLEERVTVAALGIAYDDYGPNNNWRDGLHFKAFNTDSEFGKCAFQYVSLARINPGRGERLDALSNEYLESGEVGYHDFNGGNQLGDRWSWEVYFSRPFSTPPIVMVTAHHVFTTGEANVHKVAPLGIVSDVTPYGFTLNARNTDNLPGYGAFYWVAFGCGEGCG